MTHKVAISLPADMFKRLERARRKSGLSRSAAVQQALEEWLAAADREALCRAYIEGYRRVPEGEQSSWVAAQMWSPWEND